MSSSGYPPEINVAIRQILANDDHVDMFVSATPVEPTVKGNTKQVNFIPGDRTQYVYTSSSCQWWKINWNFMDEFDMSDVDEVENV